MRPNRLSLAILSLAVAGALAAPLRAQEPKKAEAKPEAKAEAKKPAAAMPSQEEAMKAWQAYMTPGEQHKFLEGGAGTWIAKAKAWMDPGKPPEETEGTMESKMILGGRYLEERYEGKMMGQPLTGVGYTGYDNYKKKYVSTWMDTAMTGIMVMTGTVDKTGKVMTSYGTVDDVVMKKPSKVKSVLTIVDADTHKYEMWMAGPDGKMVKNLEIVYTRKK